MNISISQFWKEFKLLPEGQHLKFMFGGDVVIKEQIRFLNRVETNNIITIRELDNKRVWLAKPKKDTIFKENNIYTLKDYTIEGDLKIEVLNGN